MFDPSLFQSLNRYDVAVLVSPFVQASNQPRCVMFYAFMYGSNVDYLNLYIRPWGTAPTLDPQFSIYGNIANEWRLYGMDVPGSNENFHVRLSIYCNFRLFWRFKVTVILLLDDNRPTSTFINIKSSWMVFFQKHIFLRTNNLVL